MKKKKVIGIDLNEVVRSHWYAVEEFYQKYMKDEGSDGFILKPFTSYEYLNHFSFPEKMVEVKYLKKDIPEDIAPEHYIVDKHGKSKADPLLFDVVKEKRTSQDRLEKFLYEDYLFECFGSCGKVYESVVTDIHKLYGRYKDDFEFMVVSLESHRSIIPTMFFCSKIGLQIPQFFFAGKPETIWSKVDVLITANPKLMTSVPKGKHVVHVIREFNKTIPVRPDIMWIDNISDFHAEDKYEHRDLNKFKHKITLIDKLKNYANSVFKTQ
jgi:hypothetical protein